MRYLYQRGPGAGDRVVHLGGYDPLTGEPSVEPICGERRLQINSTCNLPLGRPTCKRCLAKYRQLASR